MMTKTQTDAIGALDAALAELERGPGVETQATFLFRLEEFATKVAALTIRYSTEAPS